MRRLKAGELKRRDKIKEAKKLYKYMTYEEVGKEMGISSRTAFRYVNARAK